MWLFLFKNSGITPSPVQDTDLLLMLVMLYVKVAHLLLLCALLAEAWGNARDTHAPKVSENQCANSRSRMNNHSIPVCCLCWLFGVVSFEPTACGLQDTHREAQSMRRWSTAGGTAAHQDLEHWQGEAHTAEHAHDDVTKWLRGRWQALPRKLKYDQRCKPGQ